MTKRKASDNTKITKLEKKSKKKWMELLFLKKNKQINRIKKSYDSKKWPNS